MGKENVNEKVIKIVDTIKNCISLSCNTKDFDITIVSKINPKDGSMATVNSIIKKKSEGNQYRQLTVSLDIDKRNGLSHVVILNVDKLNSNILFNTTEDNPTAKIEKYLPNIVSSTQAILMKMGNVSPERKFNNRRAV